MSEAASPDADNTRPRHWWSAGLLALVSPMAAYLYAGRPARATIAFFLVIGLGLLAFNGLSPVAPYAFLAILILFPIFIVDAARIAAGAKRYRLQWFNNGWIYAGLIASGIVPVAGGDFDSFKSFSVGASSMEPSLHRGDRFVVDGRAYDQRSPRRGDIVVFGMTRSGKSNTWVKRIVGLPGDVIEIQEGVLSINGALVARKALDANVVAEDCIVKVFPRNCDPVFCAFQLALKRKEIFICLEVRVIFDNKQ